MSAQEPVPVSAQEHLSERQFYHSSPHRFKPGDLVTPGHASPGGGTGSHVYMSTDRDRARFWANARANVGEATEVHTYKVEPTYHGEIYGDPEDEGGTGKDFMTQLPVRVVRKLPGSAHRVGQGGW